MEKKYLDFLYEKRYAIKHEIKRLELELSRSAEDINACKIYIEESGIQLTLIDNCIRMYLSVHKLTN